jgi:hypothetical protein
LSLEPTKDYDASIPKLKNLVDAGKLLRRFG